MMYGVYTVCVNVYEDVNMNLISLVLLLHRIRVQLVFNDQSSTYPLPPTSHLLGTVDTGL